MGLRTKVKTITTTAGMGLMALVANTQNAFASGTSSKTDVQSGYTSVLGTTQTSSGIISQITTFTSTGMKIAAAIAAAYTLFHLVKAGLAMMSGSGARKEEGMQQLKMVLIGGVIALGAYFFAGVIGAIAGLLTGSAGTTSSAG